MIIITKSFREKELRNVSQYFHLEQVAKAVMRAASSGIEMGNLGFSDCKILKVRMGGKPAARMIIFLQIRDQFEIPVVLRLKKDKIFGENLSLQNTAARNLIAKNILLALEDIDQNQYEKIM